MPTATKSTAARQQRYRTKLADDGRVAMQITTTKEAATKLRTLADQRAEEPGKTLEHVLDVVAPAPLSAGQKDRIEHMAGVALAIADKGERNVARRAAGARLVGRSK